MTAPTLQRCDACGHELPERDARTSCPACGGLLSLVHAPPAARGAALRALFDERLADAAPAHVADAAGAARASGVWRFRELIAPGVSDAEIVSQPEGNTPLFHRPSVAAWAGVDALLLKHDGFNPTGSFKDRGMTVALTQARRAGARAVACASTGNTSAALAAYASLAGLPGLVLVPGAQQVALGKLAQTLGYGARTLLVRGDFDDCLRLVREGAERLGVYLVNSINPYRIEGQKSVALEILQQLRWDAPDWIVLPAGNLGNTSAVGAALRDAVRLGLIDRAPRVASVQAAGANPFALGFREGFASPRRVKAETVATAIKIGDPASWDRAASVIREFGGVVTEADDAAILEAKAAIDAAGIGCEPASAASVAGVRRLVREGVIRPGERVAAILTGHVLKDPGVLLDYHRAGRDAPLVNAPVEIDATLDGLARAIDAVAS
ncbi:threonine synthase [Roseisolibacter sp. H3M3-2]|uniref:threonine synthase n=1 Tax=Roseisolibacter sp. H3M3-2 TaxID=3031323 RepID=UPI0023DCA9AD|nr:threonine synthase [Roseisolibacter sp. H3M3-2]MDF1503714.1 threonine synthase [Roseisolibacter sp. H3M3-2]